MIVTRFAPSPTGYLHVGGARTALFNWLLAKKTGGKFILRIEDTDQKRNTPTAMKQVMHDLRWLGIEWDEGPEVDGPNGPYLQSKRLGIYKEYLNRLLAEGKAYYCFDTPEELTAQREKARREKKNLVYKRPEKFPNEDDLQKAIEQGRPVTVRFAVPQNETIKVTDIVRGEIEFKPAEIGDFIIQKSDGFPTYHFACVIDDELMGVTHVCRGQEHLMNTPGHIALQKALGFTTPTYAHMSVTVSEGGGKLSKRERPKALRLKINSMQDKNVQQLADAGGVTVDEIVAFLDGKSTPDMLVIDKIADHLDIKLPEINVIDFFRSGYLPETMINFLALLGWNPGTEEEIMTVDELIHKFDVDRLSKTNSLFDRKKLLAFNTEHIKITPIDKLVGHFKDYVMEIDSPVQKADDNMLRHLVQINEGARTLEQIDQKCRFLFVENDQLEYDPKAVKKVLKKNGAIDILATIKDRLAAMDELSEEAIEKMLRGLAEEKGVGLGKVAQPLRVSICGNTISPPIFDSVKLLGRENTLNRMEHTIKKFSPSE